jgi:two-component system response regulator
MPAIASSTRQPESDVVLLVDDDERDRVLAIRELRRHGVENAIAEAHDGPTALTYLFDVADGGVRRPLPLIVLLDLGLPGVDGIDVLRRIRADLRTERQPVLVLTASRADVHTMQSKALQAVSFVQKPLTFARFQGALQKLGLAPHLRCSRGGDLSQL